MALVITFVVAAFSENVTEKLFDHQHGSTELGYNPNNFSYSFKIYELTKNQTFSYSAAPLAKEKPAKLVLDPALQSVLH